MLQTLWLFPVRSHPSEDPAQRESFRTPRTTEGICYLHTGTDGSCIFRSGIGFSLVIDPQGRLWRAATVEDFETTYTLTSTACEIDTMTPIYATMREYVSSYYLKEELSDSSEWVDNLKERLR